MQRRVLPDGKVEYSEIVPILRGQALNIVIVDLDEAYSPVIASPFSNLGCRAHKTMGGDYLVEIAGTHKKVSRRELETMRAKYLLLMNRLEMALINDEVFSHTQRCRIIETYFHGKDPRDGKLKTWNGERR